jgi:hypothetical protein
MWFHLTVLRQAVFLLLAGMLWACAADPGAGSFGDGDAGEEEEEEEEEDDGRRDTGIVEDSGSDQDSNSDTSTEGRERLEFLNAGDDSVRMLISGATELAVRHVDAFGNPLEGGVVEFAIISGDPRGARLREETGRADENGVAGVNLVAGDREAQFDVEARLRGASEVDPLQFQITVRTKEASDYTFISVYDETTRPLRLQQVTYIVFDEELSCDEVTEFPGSSAFDLALPSARERIPLGSIYDPLPYPNEDPIPLTGVIALAADVDGRLLAWGCNDGPFELEDGSPIEPELVEFGDEVLVYLDLVELYPLIAGDYDVQNELDLFELLPPNIQGPVRTIIQFFSSPGQAIYDILVDTDVIPDLGGAADIFLGIIDDLFFSLIPPDVREIFGTVENIGEALQTVKLNGSMLIFDNPDASGNFQCGELVLNQVVIDIELLDEANRTLDLRRRGYDAFYGRMANDLNLNGGSVTIQLNDRGEVVYGLNLNPFQLAINYGQIILFILEDIVFPAAFGPGVDSLDEAIGTLIDCADIAASISVLSDFIEGACLTAITVASDELRGFLSEQSLEVGAGYQLATPILGSTAPADVELLEDGMTWGPCEMEIGTTDNGELQATRLGATGSRRCVWDARLFADPSDTVGRRASAAFFGQRRRDIGRAMVCGDGM